MSDQGGVELPHDENDPFTKKVAMSVAIIAVVLAIASTGGKSAGKDMMSGQLDAANEWSRYQAKVQREVLYMQERETLEQIHGAISDGELAKLADDYDAIQKKKKPATTDNAERQKQRLAYISKKLEEYKSEKEELSKSAREFEAQRKLAQRKDPYFDYAELLLQFSIVLASVAMLSKARWPFLLAILLAVLGAALTVGGFVVPEHMPDVHIPLIDPAPEQGKKT